MRRALLTTAFILLSPLTGCGPDKPAPKDPQWVIESSGPHHDYSVTWVYAVGEVDAPTANDCKKAFSFAEAESECVGAACRFGSDLVSDYRHACQKLGSAEQRQRMKELGETLKSRSGQAPTDCVKEVDDWLGHGCGTEGACEPGVQRWATRCVEQTKSPLALHLIQRVLENSFHESHRVKLDARGCSDYSKKLEKAAKCDKLFDCEDALPLADLYQERCSQGQGKTLTLTEAEQVDHIRLGAGKSVAPIAISDAKSKLVSLPGTLAFTNGTGAVVKVCGEALTDLAGYLSQRKSCQNGEIELLFTVKGAEGATLELQKRSHESDTSFNATYPSFLVEGEADARGQLAIEEFVVQFGALPEKATQDFTRAFEQVNDAYAAVEPGLRQSPKLYQALAVHDAALSEMFGLIGEQKVSIASKRLSNQELSALARRANRYVFSDLTRQGSVELGKNAELGELSLDRALPKAFAAYKQGLAKLNDMVDKRHLKLTEKPEKVHSQLAAYAEACSTARDQIHTARKKLEHCSSSADACSTEERSRNVSSLQKAQNELSSARVEEILAKSSAGQREEPSAECSRW
jgi:hypothetical protein